MNASLYAIEWQESWEWHLPLNSQWVMQSFCSTNPVCCNWSKCLQFICRSTGVYTEAQRASVIPQIHLLFYSKYFKVSLRRQQVSEKLNEWAVFSEKNKELCEWLTQMESKVSQNGDIVIEEMIEKLRKVSCSVCVLTYFSSTFCLFCAATRMLN